MTSNAKIALLIYSSGQARLPRAANHPPGTRLLAANLTAIKRFVAAAAVLALAAPLPLGAQTVKVGVINSITGPEAPIGENLTNGIKLAEEDLSRAGIKLELISEDDTGKPQIAMSAMEKLATRDGVAGVVGPYTSSSANAVAKLAQRYRVPLLIPSAAKEEITRQGYDWVYRLNAPANIYAQVLLDAVTELGKPKTIAFVYENTDFGTSTADAGKKYAEKKGLKIVADEPYSKGSPDHRSTLTKISALKPDLVFMVSYVVDAILLMRQAREVGLRPQAFLGGGAGFTTAQFASDKSISNLVLTSTQWAEDVNWPGAAAFAKRYQAKFGKEATYHAACAYAAMMIMADTAAKQRGDRAKIRGALASGSWQGIMGNVKFEAYDGYTNQNKHQMLVLQIQNGSYVAVYPAQFAVKKAIYPFPGW